jgi:phosphoribosylglycinamide formyltransferase 1
MMRVKPRIAILASGRGSNFEAIAKSVQSGELDAEIACVVSDKADAPVLQKAKTMGIDARCKPIARGGDWGVEWADALQRSEVDFLVLAGFMRILPKSLIESFDSKKGYFRIVNIHPSLLPAFPGLDAYRQAFEHGAKVTGATVHLVDHGLDSGPICAQAPFSIEACASVEEVESLGLKAEHELYPETLRWVLKEAFTVERGGRRVRKG